MSIGRTLRGIRDRIPPGYVLGRVKPGNGPVELIKVAGLGQPVGQGGNSNLTANGITALTGDVTAEGPGEVPATLASTGVTPGSYTNTDLTVDAKGRITAAANGSGSGLPALDDGKIWIGDAANVAQKHAPSGDATFSNTAVVTLANTAVTPGSYTSADITVDSKGRITAAANGSGGTPAAEDVTYDNTGSGLSATNVQDAIDELATGLPDPYEYVVETVTTTSSAATITFSSMPSSPYKSLRIELWARGDDAGADVRLEIRFNGDTGSNYDYQQSFFQNNSTFVQAAAQTRIFGPQFPGAGTTSNYYGNIFLDIPDFANTTAVKEVLGRCAYFRTGTGMRSMITGGQWLSTAAITSITLLLNSGNFVDGSTAKLIARL